MDPIDWHQRKPEDHECLVLRYGSHTTRHCWFGALIYHAGVTHWEWKWCSVPDKTAWHHLWPQTHWLPAGVEMLPAVYGNNGTDSARG